MTKSRKPAKTQMPSSRPTDLEVYAALHLIHLSGGESSDDYNHNKNSDQELCSGGVTVEDGNLDDQDFPPKNQRFRSLVDIYSKTAPIPAKKRGPSGAGKKNKNRRKDVMVR